MKTEHVNSTRVRHDWKSIVEGVASGKRYVVENYGQPEAAVIPPHELQAGEFDLKRFFAEVKASPPLKLENVEIARSNET
jgi:hypothetical protein